MCTAALTPWKTSAAQMSRSLQHNQQPFSIFFFLGTLNTCARSINTVFILLSGQTWTLQAGLVLSGWEALQLLPQSGGQGEDWLLHGINCWSRSFVFLVLICLPLGPSALWGSCRCARPWCRKWTAPATRTRTTRQEVGASCHPTAPWWCSPGSRAPPTC